MPLTVRKCLPNCRKAVCPVEFHLSVFKANRIDGNILLHMVLGFIICTLVLVEAQQQLIRYNNQNFRNIRAPLATAASKERPYLSIPIVLMPDGQIVPKPTPSNYQYISNMPAQGYQQNSKNRGMVMTGETDETYQVMVPPPPSFIQEQKQIKMMKNGVNGRNPVAVKEQRPSQILVQNSAPKYFQQNDNGQTMSLMQLQNQRNPLTQQQMISNVQTGEMQKQNVANFLNFATQLGSEVLSQQRGRQNNLHSSQASLADVKYALSDGQKAQDAYVMQVPSSQDQMNGQVYAQDQTQLNSASQNSHILQKSNTVQQNNYNTQQYQHSSASAPVQYLQTQNIRQSNQRVPSQAGSQNQATKLQQNAGGAIYFPGNQNNPSQTSYIQLTQQNGNQNYPEITSQQAANHNYQSMASQKSAQNVQLMPAKNYEQQTENNYAQQPTIELLNHDASVQTMQSNYGIQNEQSYVTADGHPINFANAAQATPVTYRSQQNGYQNIQNTQQNGYQNNPNTQQTGYQSSPNTQQNGYQSNTNTQQNGYQNNQNTQQNGYQNNQNTQQNGYQSNTNSQQNGHQNSQNTQQNTQQNVHQSPVESGNQNVYVSHQNSQDLGQTFATAVSLPQHASSTQNHQQMSSSHQTNSQTSASLSNNQNGYANLNGQVVYKNQPEAYTGHNGASIESGAYTYGITQPTYTTPVQTSQMKYSTSTPASNNYQEYQYEYSTQNKRGERKLSDQEPVSSTNGGQIIYASSSAKQINYTPSIQESLQLQGNAGQPSAYVSLPSNYKSDSSSSGVVTSKIAHAKQSQTSFSNDESSEATGQDSNSDEEDEETSYKVVYIPLDILKNILGNSVDNQRSDKSS
ncbi:uncharacterized protein CDAR_530171 [Caerostris darwini]|uniref:Uncharacterized protein n=1 Tax=Caerostris darwini TaxID=1538125 RepID=A0AAV4RYN0_9ARAC|nr:uncharacterized protein CDAR_530171 [Caerostris darwini]